MQRFQILGFTGRRFIRIFSLAVALGVSVGVGPSLVHAEDRPGSEWVARVDGTDRQGAQVRSGPGIEFSSPFALPDGTVVRVIQGSVTDLNGRTWCPVALGGPGTTRGWIARELLVPVASSGLGGVPLMAAGLRSDGLRADGLRADDQPLRRIQATVTAYTYQTPGRGAHGFITRSGTVVHWGTVAVDPAVIPLGSALRIEGYPDIFIAEDTGGAIHGSRLEIFFPDEESALRFGVQQREVTILDSRGRELASGDQTP